MLLKLSNLNSNLALTLGYLNPALNNSALEDQKLGYRKEADASFDCFQLPTAAIFITNWRLLYLEDAID